MNKFSRAAFFIAMLVVLSSLCFSDTIRFDISFDADRVDIDSRDGYQRVMYRDPNAHSLAGEGEPDLPFYMLRVLIPADSRVESIEFDERDRFFIREAVPAPFMGYEIISRPVFSHIVPDPAIYSGGGIYPEKRLVVHSTGRTRGYQIMYFSYCPFEFDTAAGKLYMYRDLSFSIKYRSAVYQGLNEYRPNAAFNEIVSRSVINRQDMPLFYPEKTDPVKSRLDYDMLIITTDTLLGSAQDYADYRESDQISCDIKTLTEIESGYPGSTTQIKIKNCIFDYVQNNNISYVLLIGDGGTSSTYGIPDQNLYGYLSFVPETDNTLPGDVFYSCFDGQFDWNADGDSYVGEISGDNADILPDVIIGRLSVRTSQQVLDYKAKVIQYMDAGSDSAFPKNLGLSGVQLFNYSGDAKAKSELMYSNYIQPYWAGHNKSTLYDSDTTVSVSTLSSLLNQGMNFFHMATHGNVTIWSMASGSSFSSASALALNNIPGIVVTIACITNAFDPEVSGASDPCLGEAFIRNANGGAVVYLGASRYGIGYNSYDTHGPSFQYNDWIFRHTLDTAYENVVGAGFTQSKIQMAGSADSDYSFRWVHFALNYLGDPSLKAHKDVQSSITAPSDLQASALSSSQAQLSWNDNSDNETGFSIERKTGAGGVWAEAGSAGADTQSWQDTGLSANTAYYYRVRAYNAVEYSAYSNESYVFTHSMPLGEALDNMVLPWSTSSSAGAEYVWYGQGESFFYGGSSARSGAIGSNSSTSLSTQVTGPGTLIFHWRVSSESGYDYLRFYIDGEIQDSISGIVGWEEKSYEIGEGTFEIKWSYIKDAYVEENEDAGWVDYVRWAPDSEPESAIISIEDSAVKGIYTWSYSAVKPVLLGLRGSAWNKILNQKSASRIETGDISGDGVPEFVVLIPGEGLFYYDQSISEWANISVYDTLDFTLAKTSQDNKRHVVASFASYGLYKLDFDSMTWSKILQYPADRLQSADFDREGDGIDELIATFEGINRLYLYDFTAGAFTPILMSKPGEFIAGDITGDGGTELICSFEGIGIYLARYIPDRNSKGDSREDIFEKYHIIDLEKEIKEDNTWISKNGESRGLQWNRILMANPDQDHKMAAGDISGGSGLELILTFQGNVYYYDYSIQQWNLLAGGAYRRILSGRFTAGEKDDLIMANTANQGLYLRRTLSADFELLTANASSNAMAVIR